MTDVTIDDERKIYCLTKLFHDEGNEWLGSGFHLFNTWLENKVKSKVVINSGAGSITSIRLTECDNKFITYLLLL